MLQLIDQLKAAIARDEKFAEQGEQADTATAVMDHEGWKQAGLRRALLGRNLSTKKSITAGVKKWAEFSRDFLGDGNCGFPVKRDNLVLWSSMFKNGATFSNNVGYVKSGCLLLGFDIDAFEKDVLKRVKVNVNNNVPKVAKPDTKRWIQHNLLLSVVHAATSDPSLRETAMWMVAAYAFMLRVPSECLPIVAGMGCGDCMEPSEPDGGRAFHAEVTVNEESIWLTLQSRKNKSAPSTIKRHCWCRTCKLTCPVHALGGYLKGIPRGSCAFPTVTDRAANRRLRKILGLVGISDVENYTTHCLRRGHTMDMAEGGSSLSVILEAGGWCSKRFALYVDVEKLQGSAALAAKLDEFDMTADGV